ncbi:MAG: hypothetical protein SH819_14545 [Cytophagales bacterium]|nr:hypothetical protein [Cytophagales bacterium]
MLDHFRINDPYRLISLLLLLSIAALPWLIDSPAMTLQELKGAVLGERIWSKFMYSGIIDHTAPLQAVMEGVMNFLFGRSILARHMLALFIIFFQASFFAILLIQNKAYNENTYVPSLLFGFLCLFSFDVLALTPELFASTLLLMALNNVFKEVEFRVERDAVVLNLGVFIGLASLFVFSYTVFLFGVVFILVAFARADVRKISLLFFGYALMHAIVFTFYYFHDRTGDLWSHFYLAQFGQSREFLLSTKALLILAAIPLGYFVISLLMLTRAARFTRYQSQLFQVLLIWMIVAIIELFLARVITPHSFLTFIPPLAYFISHYLLVIRRRRIAEFMLSVFLIGLMTVSLAAYYKKITGIDYGELFPKTSPYEGRITGKRVMVVGEDMALYKANSMGGCFLDWNLSRRYFEEPDAYANIIRVHDSFTRDAPDVIIDEAGLMGPFLERIPSVKKSYRKEGAIYWRVSN